MRVAAARVGAGLAPSLELVLRAAQPRTTQRAHGIAGVDLLRAPEDAERAFTALARRVDERVRALVDARPAATAAGGTATASAAAHALRVLGGVDELSDDICRLADPMAMLSCTHPDERMRQCARRASAQVQALVSRLNADVGLYCALAAVVDEDGRSAAFGTLSEEAQRVGRSLLLELRHGGVHLTDERDRARVEQLDRRAVELCAAFEQGVSALAGAGTPALLTGRKAGLSEANARVLVELLHVRRERAAAVGFPSFSSMALAQNMLNSVNDVHAMLDGVLARRFAHAATAAPPSSVLAFSDALSGRLSAFDALAAASQMAHDFFGVLFDAATVHDGELWHDDVRKVAVHDENGSLLGHVYLDLVTRPGKWGSHAVHVVRCGRVAEGGAGDRVLPVVSLVAHMPAGGISGEQARTLFHEFGHVMHASMLSQTTYQHVWGTRVPVDFVEVPSTLFESVFDWPEHAAPYLRAQDALPRSVAAAHRESSMLRDARVNLARAAFDLRVHSEWDAASSGSTLHEIAAEVRGKFGVAPPYTSDLHLITPYASMLYAYTVGDVVARALWEDVLLPGGGVTRALGATLCTELLRHGGARDPKRMVTSVFASAGRAAPLH